MRAVPSKTQNKMKTLDKIKAARFFGLDKSSLRNCALKLALWEMQKREECRDMGKVERILAKWRLRDAFSFYCANPSAY
jgi:hypothetical protein